MYLATAIDQNPEGTDVEDVLADLKANPHTEWVYHPAGAFLVGTEATPDGSIHRVNLQALRESNAMVAILPAGVPSIGVPTEIEWMASQGKPVLVISDVQSWAWNLDRPNVRVEERWLPWHTSWIARLAKGGVPVEPLPYTAEQGGYDLAPPAYPGDAGIDLVASETVTIGPGQIVDVPSSVAVQLPSWSWGLVIGRSSALRTKGVHVHLGVIDEGYRGELSAACQNLRDHPVTVERGQRVAQLVVMYNGTRHVRPLPVDKLDPSDRGTKGFGSSGG